MIYATSDTHFFHKRIIELAGRPFMGLDHMHATMVRRWNEVVSKHDDVWHLGDFAYDDPKLWELFAALNGRKHLVVGNHDEAAKGVLRLPWQSIQHHANVRYEGLTFVLNHFPIEQWWRIERGYIHLHGHCHGSRKLPPRQHRFDLGADCWNFTPVSLDTLAKLAILQGPFDPTDFYHDGKPVAYVSPSV